MRRDLRKIRSLHAAIFSLLAFAPACTAVEDFSLHDPIARIYIYAWDTTLGRDIACSYLIAPQGGGKFVAKVRYHAPGQDIRFERNLPKEHVDQFLDAYTTFETRPFGWFWFRVRRALTRASEKSALKVDHGGEKEVIRIIFLLENGEEVKFVSQERAPSFWLAEASGDRKAILYSERFTENLERLIARIDDFSRKRKAVEN